MQGNAEYLPLTNLSIWVVSYYPKVINITEKITPIARVRYTLTCTRVEIKKNKPSTYYETV